MKRARGNFWVKLMIFAAFFQVISASTILVSAQEERCVDTEGSVQFTGVYEPDKPEPSPPTGPTQPGGDGGRLPQTNTRKSSSATALGSLLLLIAGYSTVKKTRRYQKERTTSRTQEKLSNRE
jgi:LPXTG-motif cell wall-anchored protein